MQEHSLHYYIETAKEHSPFIRDYRNQTEIEQVELEWRISFAVLFISVLGICGCLLALWLTGVPLNVSSYTGIIMVVGIIAENAIFTVWQYRMNRNRGGCVSQSVDYAIALRIRPKLMTAIGAVLALLPLTLGIGLGAQMQQPLAVAVIGGFIVGLPLLLLVLPSIMLLIYKRENYYLIND